MSSILWIGDEAMDFWVDGVPPGGDGFAPAETVSFLEREKKARGPVVCNFHCIMLCAFLKRDKLVILMG